MPKKFCLVIVFVLGCSGFDDPTGRSDTKLRSVDTNSRIERGQTIVKAIHQFQNEYGLWPNDLDELALIANRLVTSAEWEYKTWHDGGWTLTNYSGFPQTSIRFSHPKEGSAQWLLFWGDGQKPLDAKQDLPGPSPGYPVLR